MQHERRLAENAVGITQAPVALGGEMNYSKIKILAALLALCAGFSFAQQSSAPSENFTSAQIENSQVSLDFSENSDSENNFSSSGSFGGIGIFVQMILVLGIIVAAIYFLFKFMRRSMGVEPAAEDDVFLRKVSFISLGEGKSVQVVSLWNKAFILGVSDNSVSLIKEIDDKDLIDAMNRYADMNSTAKKPRSFEEILQLFMPKKEAQNENVPESKKSAYDKGTMDLIKSLKSKITGGEEK